MPETQVGNKMTKLEKKLGNKGNCPSCNAEIVCGEKEYKGEITLQWQNPDGTAHYSYDFKTKTTSCKAVMGNVQARVSGVTSRGEIHLKDLKLSLDVLASVEKETSSMLDVQLARIYYIEQGLKAKGIEASGPFVGMLYIQQMESLRNQ